MSTLHDLRETLDRHADGLDDTERHARVVAVRDRVRVVRRRRAAVASVAAVLALVAGGAVVGGLRGPGPVQPAAVAGIDVPESVSVLAFPYDLIDTAALGDGETVELHAKQAVSLVGSGLGSGSATLLRDGDPVARVMEGEPVAAPLPVDDGATFRLRLDGAPADARAGVAVYEATGELAPGVHQGRTVFRETYAGQPLLGAGFAEDGASSVSFTTDPGRLARIVGYCVAPEDGLFLTVEVDGEPTMALGCHQRPRTDAATGTSGTVRLTDDGIHDVRAYLTRDGEGPAVETEDVDLGVGVYAEEYAAEQLGQGVPAQVEYAGRTWRLDLGSGRRGTAAGARDWWVDARGSDLLLAHVVRGRMVTVSWEGELGGGRSTGSTDGGDHTLQGVAGVLVGGDRYRVRVDGAGDGEVRSALLVYRPL